MTDVSDYRSLPPEIQNVLRKYRILGTNRVVTPTGTTAQEGYVTTSLRMTGENGEPLGEGPVLDPTVLSRFLDADTTPDKAWLDWMLFHAGGGKDAQRRGEHLFEKSRVRFIEERVKGYTERGQWNPPISREEATRRWAGQEERFKETLTVGDQDLVNKHQIFGYFRHWPGRHRIYEKIALAVNRFLKLARKTKEFNTHLKRNGDEDDVVSFNPKDYATVEALEHASRKVERFHASKKARNDIRIETVYDDDYLTVICPLTYAAAVRYGWDEWAWSNRNSFETNLRGENDNWNDPWKNTTGRDQGVFVYIQFKVPMPSWVAYAQNGFRRHTLYNLALVIPSAQLQTFNPDTIRLFDEENRQNITLAQIKDQIRDEGRREWNPEEEEYPVQRGPRVYNDEAEAEEVVKHLDAALDATKQWAATFDPRKVVSDYMA